MSEYEVQPVPSEFQHKRSIFERLQNMAAQMQKMRRAAGYAWLEGGVTTMDDATGAVIVHARQSGLILVTVAEPNAHLRMEESLQSRLQTFHWDLAHNTMRTAEYAFDEAMFSERMS